MTYRHALTLARQLFECEIKRLAVQANLHDVYHADAPACVEASRRRRELRAAMNTLKEPEQMRMKL
jgi:hypothetical protein